MTPAKQALTITGLDPLIHEASRLLIMSVLRECDVADFNFLLGTTGLTRGNMSVHIRKLAEGGYVEEKKEFVNRMPHTEYRLTKAGQTAFKKYAIAWKKMTNLGASKT